jgi:hypothetical protein
MQKDREEKWRIVIRAAQDCEAAALKRRPGTPIDRLPPTKTRSKDFCSYVEKSDRLPFVNSRILTLFQLGNGLSQLHGWCFECDEIIALTELGDIF